MSGAPAAQLRGKHRGDVLVRALARVPRVGEVVELVVDEPTTGGGSSQTYERAVRQELAAAGRADPDTIAEHIFPLERFFADGPAGVRASWGAPPAPLTDGPVAETALDACMERLRSTALENHPRALPLPPDRWPGLEAILVASVEPDLLRLYAVCSIQDWAADVSGLLQGLEHLLAFMAGELGRSVGPLQVRCRVVAPRA